VVSTADVGLGGREAKKQPNSRPASEGTVMNELTNRDVKLIERMRSAYAELDPVPDDVLAAARGAFKTIREHTFTDGGSHA
jgi:hypothetical protein